MNQTEIIRKVKECIKNGDTVIISPRDMSYIWSQPELDNVPHIASEGELFGKIFGIEIYENLQYPYGKRSKVHTLEY